MTEPAHPSHRKAAKGSPGRKAPAAAPHAKARPRDRGAAAAQAGEAPDAEAPEDDDAAPEPLEGEVVPPGISPSASQGIGTAARWIEGMLPTADGGPPPVLTAARVRFAGWIWAGVGLLGGCIAGALVVLLAAGIPSIPMALAGLSAGALLGAMIALVFASRFPVVRKAGGVAILLAPLLLLAAPFLLLAGGIALLLRFPKRPKAKGT